MVSVYRIRSGRGSLFSGVSLTNRLIILNVALFFVSWVILSAKGEEFFLNNFALTPSLILSGHNLWTFVTSMFFHGGFFFFFANKVFFFFLRKFLAKII